MPEWFIGIDKIMVVGIPLPVVIFIVVALVLGFVLSGTIFGRQIYQTGTNEVAARHAGIRSARIKFGLFLLIGLVAAIAGIMTASRLGFGALRPRASAVNCRWC